MFLTYNAIVPSAAQNHGNSALVVCAKWVSIYCGHEQVCRKIILSNVHYIPKFDSAKGHGNAYLKTDFDERPVILTACHNQENISVVSYKFCGVSNPWLIRMLTEEFFQVTNKENSKFGITGHPDDGFTFKGHNDVVRVSMSWRRTKFKTALQLKNLHKNKVHLG